MNYSHYIFMTMLPIVLTKDIETELQTHSITLEEAQKSAKDHIKEVSERFLSNPITPSSAAEFEKDMQQATRELGRVTIEWSYNHIEPDNVQVLPKELEFEGSRYRRLGKKTRQEVSTLFGKIFLYRLGFRETPSLGEPILFPLCRALGLVYSATPALVERIAYYQAVGGATQGNTLNRLLHEHNVTCSVKRLRQITKFVAEAMEEHRLETQVEKVLEWLQEAQNSKGSRKPVLSIGRDGITLGLRGKKGSPYEVASTGTITVYNRKGIRIGTVYLGYTPESNQMTMSKQLTSLLNEVLNRWKGPLPRMCYVTDAGSTETTFYKKMLRRMRHPQTGEKMEWNWVVDYFHASERLWTMAKALFGEGQKSTSWVRKMQKLLKKPGGAGRVLHSAAAMRSRMKLKGKRLKEFEQAYKYLQCRRKHLRYAEFKKLHFPIGSGVTEAACKTVYTQRLKLSGMRWKKKEAQSIITLRVILLSKVWERTFQRILTIKNEVNIVTPGKYELYGAKNAV